MARTPSEELIGFPVSKIAEICRVSPKTAQRWKAGTVCPPQTALMIISGNLGVFDPEWSGWILCHGCLISPEGWQIRMPDVLASRLHEAQLGVYRSENRRLKAELEYAVTGGLEDQPLPDSWDVQIIVA